jgi:hypothetical protein
MSSRTVAGSLLTISLVLTLAQAKLTFAAEGKADEADPAAKVQKLNRYAMQLFDDLNFMLAEKTLLEALAIVEKTPRLASGPAELATSGNLAVLYSVGLKNPDKAVAHFKKALAIKPDLKMSKQRATPETEANLARAKAEMAGGGGAAPSRPSPPAVASKAVQGADEVSFKCPSDGEIQAGADATLKCMSSPALNVATVMLHYRANGGDQYEVLQMTKSGTSGGNTVWQAKIPGSQTKAQWIPVYFEARDDKGGTLAQSGREDSPNVIVVKGGQSAASAPTVAKEEGDEEGDEETEDEGEIDDDNPLARLEKERRREHEGSKGTWFVGFGLGSGFGYAHAKSTEAYGKYGVGFNSGFAPALLGQAVPEVGYFVGRNTAIALALRAQAIFPRGPEGTATGAITGLLRLMFYTEDESKVRWYFSLVGGAGEGFRFQVEAQLLDNAGNPVVNPDTGKPVPAAKDTVRGGPFVAGAGGGMEYRVSRHFRWTIDTQVLVGFTNVSGLLDLGTGLRYQF